MYRIVAILMVVCLLLSGCSWMDGNYSSITLHEDHTQVSDSREVTASNYGELLDALYDLIELGKEKGVIYVGEMDQTRLDFFVEAAIKRTLNKTPLGAYAVEDIHCEIGTSNGKPAVAVEIAYLHGRAEIRQIRQVADMEEAEKVIYQSLCSCDASLVLQVDNYEQVDLAQIAQDYGVQYPELVMEVPQVTVGLYPQSGSERILEIFFTYQNSRDVLRQMQTQVSYMFEAATLYVSDDSADSLKLSRLYGFIAGLGYEFQFDTSITPAYSLLRHGVGDSRAFAAVYSAMCRQAGMECYIVTGTRDAQAHDWNIVRDGDRYVHIDLQRCIEQGSFETYSDKQMSGYVWDYSAYPACEGASAQEQATEPENQTETGENVAE